MTAAQPLPPSASALTVSGGELKLRPGYGLPILLRWSPAWREVQFATESRLKNEARPVEEIHFAPGWPITLRTRFSAYF